MTNQMPPKRKPPESPADRLPPHSQEAEQAVLGAVLLAPERFREADRSIDSPELFYDLRHQIIWQAIRHCGNNGGIDNISVWQRLKDQQLLDQVGGLAYVSGLPESVPSVENLPNWLQILKDKAILRRTIRGCTEVIGRAFEHEGDIEDFLSATRGDLSCIVDEKDQGGDEVWGIKQLANFDYEHDPNAIVGVRNGKTTRYLCRGYSSWLIGPSGIGKSSLIHQMAFCFALGTSVFGIAPVKPLNILIVQAENDEGDAAEMTQGVLRSFGIDELTPDQLEALNERVHVVTERRTVGGKFCQWLARQIRRFNADLVFVDPFLSFAGVDVSRQDQCSLFLRQQLNPVLCDTGAVLIAAHHTGKPKPQKELKSWTAFDYAYAGIGSSELVNWARAVMVLLPLGDGTHFELKLTKRGSRAGATDLDGSFTNSIFLRHAHDRIYWEQVEAPEQEEEEQRGAGKPSKVNVIKRLNKSSFLARCTTEGEGKNEIAKRLRVWLSKLDQPMDVSVPTCKRVIEEMVENRELAIQNDLYVRGKNA